MKTTPLCQLTAHAPLREDTANSSLGKEPQWIVIVQELVSHVIAAVVRMPTNGISTALTGLTTVRAREYSAHG